MAEEPSVTVLEEEEYLQCLNLRGCSFSTCRQLEMEGRLERWLTFWTIHLVSLWGGSANHCTSVPTLETLWKDSQNVCGYRPRPVSCTGTYKILIFRSRSSLSDCPVSWLCYRCTPVEFWHISVISRSDQTFYINTDYYQLLESSTAHTNIYTFNSYF